MEGTSLAMYADMMGLGMNSMATADRATALVIVSEFQLGGAQSNIMDQPTRRVICRYS